MAFIEDKDTALKNIDREDVLYLVSDKQLDDKDVVKEALKRYGLNLFKDSLMTSIEKLLYKNHAYIISSIGDEGCHIGRFKSLKADANGNWVICADIDKEPITEK